MTPANLLPAGYHDYDAANNAELHKQLHLPNCACAWPPRCTPSYAYVR